MDMTSDSLDASVPGLPSCKSYSPWEMVANTAKYNGLGTHMGTRINDRRTGNSLTSKQATYGLYNVRNTVHLRSIWLQPTARDCAQTRCNWRSYLDLLRYHFMANFSSSGCANSLSLTVSSLSVLVLNQLGDFLPPMYSW